MVRRKVKWNVYVSATTRDAVNAMAKRERRSPSQMLEWLIEQEVARGASKASSQGDRSSSDLLQRSGSDLVLVAARKKGRIKD